MVIKGSGKTDWVFIGQMIEISPEIQTELWCILAAIDFKHTAGLISIDIDSSDKKTAKFYSLQL